MLLIEAIRSANADEVARRLQSALFDDFTLGVMAARSIDFFSDRWGVDTERRLFWDRLEICIALAQRYGPNRVMFIGDVHEGATLLQYAMRKVPGYPESPSFRHEHPRFTTRYLDDKADANPEDSDDDYDRSGLPKNPIAVTRQLVDALILRAGANPVAPGVFATAVEFGLHELMSHPRIVAGAPTTRWSLVPLMRGKQDVPLARIAATLAALQTLEEHARPRINYADPCDRWTALHCFADRIGRSEEHATEDDIIQRLLRLGANPLLPDALEQRALHYAGAPSSPATTSLRRATEIADSMRRKFSM